MSPAIPQPSNGAPKTPTPPASLGGRIGLPASQMQARYDVVVVGSGYGGGIAASRLARAGRRVCLLERGREMRPGEYPDTVMHATREMQLDTPAGHVGRRLGLFDFRLNDGMSALVGCGLGGTSLINANVALRAVPAVWEDPRWPQEVRNDVPTLLEDGYRHAEAMLRPTPYPDSAPRLPKLDALRQSAEHLGWGGRFYKPPINVTFADGASPAGVAQKACVGCGDCVSGCNHGAKNTTLMNYLPDAWNHGAEIFPQCSVDWVEASPQGWIVHYHLVEEGREVFQGPDLLVQADVVILAAGTLGSTQIMLRSKAKGLPASEQVGAAFSGNGDVLAFGYDGDRPIHGIGFGHHPPGRLPVVGPCITGIIDHRDTPDVKDGFVIEDGSLPGAIADILPEALGAVADAVGKDTSAATHGAAHWLKQQGDTAQSILLGPRRGAADRTQTYLVMAHDGGAGRLRLDASDRLRIDDPGVGREPIFQTVDDALRRASGALGATHVMDPLWTRLLGKSLITVHPLGGCIMASRAELGVVDGSGRVFSGTTGTSVHDGLYIADGSIVPVSLGVNPLLTISALAERAMVLLAKERGWSIDYTLPSRPRQAQAPPTLGLRFTERMRGWISSSATADYEAAEAQGIRANSPLEVTLTVEAADLDAMMRSPTHRNALAGTAVAPSLSAGPLAVTGGTMDLFIDDPSRADAKRMVYGMVLASQEGKEYFLRGFKLVTDTSILHSWAQTTTLYVTVHAGRAEEGPVVGRGILRIHPMDFARQLTTMEVTNAAGEAERLAALARFNVLFFGKTLVHAYGGVLARETFFDPAAPPRRRRVLRGPAPHVHALETSDGVPLRLTRYEGGTRGPVMLVHGLGVSSEIFSTDLPETNLVEYLCQHGYDVWLLDTRFSSILPSARRASTADLCAAIDFPEAVARIRTVTRAPSIQVFAHCYGANAFAMAMAVGLQGVRSAVISQVAANPIPPALTRLKSRMHVPSVLRLFGARSLTGAARSNEGWQARTVDFLLRFSPVGKGQACRDPVCRRVTFLYGLLYEHEQLDEHLHANIHELFGGASIETFEHLARMVRAGQVLTFDGQDTYMPHMSRLAIPIAFIHGEKNRCWLPISTEASLQLLQRTNDPALYSRHVIPGYGHLDCIFGKDAARDVYPVIVQQFERTAMP